MLRHPMPTASRGACHPPRQVLSPTSSSGPVNLCRVGALRFPPQELTVAYRITRRSRMTATRLQLLPLLALTLSGCSTSPSPAPTADSKAQSTQLRAIHDSRAQAAKALLA